jgi:peptidyl-prolyl cis-trans isomerase C
MKNFIKDPLLHFVLIGAAIFGLYSLTAQESSAERSNVITVTQADIDQLKLLWQKQWQTPPSAQQLHDLVENHIREQVFYREALAMGLDKDDTIVRRRLMQKMEFLVADVSLPKEPDAAALQKFYEDHIASYREPAHLSFSQIYFSKDKRGQQAEQDARAALETLQKAGADSSVAADYGDRIMLESTFRDRSIDDIGRDFGEKFADQLEGLMPGQWYGPFASGYGLHLVFISDIKPPAVRTLQQVSEQVKTDYLSELRKQANEKVFEKFRERYQINVVPYS